VTFSFPTFIDSSSLIGFTDGFSQGDLEFGDYDGDGDLDLVVSGDQGGSPLTQLWQNDNGTFALVSVNFENLRFSKLAWGDYDADGDLDLIICGENQANNPQTFLYQNNAGTFTALVNTGLPDVRHAALTWFDSDLDGDLDLFLTGEDGSTLVGGVYLNNMNGTFSAVETGISRFREGDVAAADYDQDGFVDLVVAGNPNVSGQSNLILRVYRNEGLNRFTQRPTASNVPGLWKGSLAWGDADQDGTPEILATGQNNTNNPFAFILALNSSTNVFEFASVNYDTVPLGVTEGEGQWGDFNDDGFQDFLYTGQDFSGALNGFLYLFNPGNNTYERQSVRSFAFQGVKQASIALGDFNNDDKLDLGLIGENVAASNQFLRLLGNVDSALNQTPVAASSLQDVQAADTVVLSWIAPANQDGFTYNVYIGTQAGDDDVVSAMSDLTSGYRKVVRRGNAGTHQEFKVTGLADGTYFWGVQAIDQDFEGSAFATGTFDYINPILTPVNTAVLDVNVPTDLHSGDLQAGDADKDGDLDLLVTGRTNSQNQTVILENTGQAFTLGQSFAGLTNGHVQWVDYDRDGHLEFVQIGLQNGSPAIQSFDHSGGLSFTEDEFVSDLPGLSQGITAWADYNQDGRLDVLLSGTGANGPFSSLYYQTTSGFVQDQSVSLPDLTRPQAAWADIDRDGDTDLALV
ncbi:MAG: VCBS repeat-containing protein, partial [Bacteroidota bacterium]